MNTSPDPDLTDTAAVGASKRRGPFLGILRGIAAITFLFIVGLGIAVGANLDRAITAPDWVRKDVEARLSEILPRANVAVRGLQVTLDRQLHTHITLQDMELTSEDGARLAVLADVRIDLLRRALARGELAAKRLEVSGLRARVSRNIDGRFNLDFGSQSVSDASFGGLMLDLATVFEQPVLTTLDAIEASSLSVRYEDAITGQVLTVDGARALLEQDRTGVRMRADAAVLTGGADVTTLTATYDVPRRVTEAETEAPLPLGTVGLSLTDARASLVAGQVPSLAWLGVLDAPISGALRFAITSEGEAADVFGTLDLGAGALAPVAGSEPLPFNSARAYFQYDAPAEKLTFDEVRFASDLVTAVASGTAYLRDQTNGVPETLLGQFAFSKLLVDPPDAFDAPIEIRDAGIDFRMEIDPFVVDIGQLYGRPQPLGNNAAVAPMVRSDGRVASNMDGWSVALNLEGDRTDVATALSLWPLTALRPTRDWLVNNLDGGTLENGRAAVRISPNQKPIVQGGFDFSDATVHYLRPMEPIKNGVGVASFEGAAFALALNSGAVLAPQAGAINAGGSTLWVGPKDGRALLSLDLKSDSTITSGLALLNQKPLEILKDGALPVTFADGRADVDVRLDVPLVKDRRSDPITFDAEGVLTSVTSDTLVADRRLSADQLNIKVSPQSIEIKGQAKVDSVNFGGVWQQPIGRPQEGVVASHPTLRAVIDLTGDALTEFGIVLPDGLFVGATKADIEVALDENGGSFTLRSDLRGANLSIPELGWQKGAASTGSLVVEGRLGTADTPAIVDRFELSGSGLRVAGQITLDKSGALSVASFSNVEVGDWFAGAVELVGQGVGQPPQVNVTGGRLDLRRARQAVDGGGVNGASGGAMDIALDRVIVSDSLSFTNLRGEITPRGGLNGSFRARVNGGAVVTGTLVTVANGTAIRLRSDDAGGVGAAAKLIGTAKGGALDLILQPTPRSGVYDGTLLVTDTRILEAPTLAGLLNAISVVGLLDQMAQGGIYFSNVEASFQLSPAGLTLYSSAATGPSIGLSMDGVYRFSDRAIDMQGVASPLYVLNGIGQVFTRRGEGLLGFNFDLSGNAPNPSVQVQPLSIFTPGMFREIFRRPPPQREND